MFSYQNKTILVVDDQKSFHIILKTMLANQDAKEIDFAENAEQAIKIATRKQYDIYLLDYNLGASQDGVQLLDYLKKNDLIPKHAICFIITGDSNKGMVLTALEKSPDDYLMKPFSQRQLSRRLKIAAQRKLAFQDIFQFISDKKYDQAIQLCREKIDQDEKYRRLCKNVLADIYIEIKKFKAAETILKPLVDLKPLVGPSISLGKAYFFQKKYKKSIAILTRLIEASPLQMEAYQWLGRAYQHENQLDDALAALTKSATTTNYSIERHQEVVLLANKMKAYKVMLDSYSAILLLNRSSFYPHPCHLANYIRCIIDHAKEEGDIAIRRNLLKKVNTVLYQSRFEEGRIKNFNFTGFDEICQAKVHCALNEPLKAKNKVFITLQNTAQPVTKFDTTFLTETLLSLLEIGEFEEAKPYLMEVENRDIIDLSTKMYIKKHTGKTLSQRIKNFKAHNQIGIKLFSAGELDKALDSFEKALALEPLNSGALLNRAQALIGLLQKQKNKDKGQLIKQCEHCFHLLKSTQLPESHASRLHVLMKEQQTLESQFT